MYTKNLYCTLKQPEKQYYGGGRVVGNVKYHILLYQLNMIRELERQVFFHSLLMYDISCGMPVCVTTVYTVPSQCLLRLHNTFCVFSLKLFVPIVHIKIGGWDGTYKQQNLEGNFLINCLIVWPSGQSTKTS